MQTFVSILAESGYIKILRNIFIYFCSCHFLRVFQIDRPQSEVTRVKCILCSEAMIHLINYKLLSFSTLYQFKPKISYYLIN